MAGGPTSEKTQDSAKGTRDGTLVGNLGASKDSDSNQGKVTEINQSGISLNGKQMECVVVPPTSIIRERRFETQVAFKETVIKQNCGLDIIKIRPNYNGNLWGKAIDGSKSAQIKEIKSIESIKGLSNLFNAHSKKNDSPFCDRGLKLYLEKEVSTNTTNERAVSHYNEQGELKASYQERHDNLEKLFNEGSLGRVVDVFREVRSGPHHDTTSFLIVRDSGCCQMYKSSEMYGLLTKMATLSSPSTSRAIQNMLNDTNLFSFYDRKYAPNYEKTDEAFAPHSIYFLSPQRFAYMKACSNPEILDKIKSEEKDFYIYTPRNFEDGIESLSTKTGISIEELNNNNGFEIYGYEDLGINSDKYTHIEDVMFKSYDLDDFEAKKKN